MLAESFLIIDNKCVYIHDARMIYVFLFLANIMENGDILFFLTESTGIKKGVPLYSNLC